MLRRPAVLITLAAVLGIAVAYRSIDGLLLGVLGLLVGAVVGLNALQLGMLLGAVVVGARVHKVVLGVGTRIWDRTTPRLILTVRAVPVLLWVSIAGGKTPVRKRMAAAAAVAMGFGLVAVAALAVAASGGQAFWVGGVIAAALLVLPELRPRKTPRNTTVGWLLFRVPRLTGRQAELLDATPAVTKVVETAEAGELTTAEVLAAELAERYPQLPSAIAARIVVLELRGRYVEALQLAIGLAGDPEQQPREAAINFAALAGITLATVEAGQLAAEVGLATANNALTNSQALGYHPVNTLGTRALLALLTGDHDTAIRLGRQSVSAADGRIARANGLATVAAAQMASGDNAAARVTLADAEKLVPWLPRVTAVRDRLAVH